MNGVKESLSRIQAWVKANPKKSAVIAVLIIVIAYFAIKRGSSSTGEGMSASAENESAFDAMGGGLADMAGGASMGGGASVPSPSGTPSVDNDAGLAGGIPQSDLFEDAGFMQEPVYTDAGFSGSAFSIINDPIGALKANNTLKNATPSTSSNKANDVIKSGSSSAAVTSKQAKDAVKGGQAMAVKNPTPAMLLGKGRHYTGFINGVWYINGYPPTITTNPITGTSSSKSNAGLAVR